jgi:hypothetical protein
MKKVFVFTLLMVMSVSFAGTSIDAAKKDKEDPIVEETPIVEDGPVSMLVSCPPGVPCDDHGGGTGGGSYDYREDPIVYPSKVEYYITTANKSVSTFDSSDYTVSEGNSSFSYNGLLYIPQDGTISRDSCYGLGGNYYPSTRNTIGRDIEITDYFVDVQGINYSKTIGDLRIVYLHEYYINGDSAHHVYEIYDNCKKYDVFENQFTGNANMINISLVEFTTWMNNEYYVITVDANTFLNRYDEYNSKLTLEEKSEIIDDVMFGLTVLTAGASMAEVALYVAGI